VRLEVLNQQYDKCRGVFEVPKFVILLDFNFTLGYDEA